MSIGANLNLWGIILAGGEGERVQDFLLKLNGDDRPKQFSTITGTKSMLRSTIDRAQLLIHPDRLLTVITHHHLRYAQLELNDRPAGTVVVQPKGKGTGVGLLLPLLKIEKQDPDSIIAVLPADHFIIEKQRFMHHVNSAADFVRSDPSIVVLLGMIPDRVESGYGWIECGSQVVRGGGSILHDVRRFWEKPCGDVAQHLFTIGCLWNTFVLVGHTETLLNLFQTFLPEVFTPFDLVRETLNTMAEKPTLIRLFDQIPNTDFSRSILERMSGQLRVLEMTGVYWSDWGEEHRIRHDVGRFKMRLTQRRAEYTTCGSPPGPELDPYESHQAPPDDVDQRLIAAVNLGITAHLGLQKHR
jgi:mannose-1-phosphate guanylyltransferase